MKKKWIVSSVVPLRQVHQSLVCISPLAPDNKAKFIKRIPDNWCYVSYGDTKEEAVAHYNKPILESIDAIKRRYDAEIKREESRLIKLNQMEE